MGDDFLTQLVKEPTRGSKILDLLFVNREGLLIHTGPNHRPCPCALKASILRKIVQKNVRKGKVEKQKSMRQWGLPLREVL